MSVIVGLVLCAVTSNLHTESQSKMNTHISFDSEQAQRRVEEKISSIPPLKDSDVARVPDLDVAGLYAFSVMPRSVGRAGEVIYLVGPNEILTAGSPADFNRLMSRLDVGTKADALDFEGSPCCFFGSPFCATERFWNESTVIRCFVEANCRRNGFRLRITTLTRREHVIGSGFLTLIVCSRSSGTFESLPPAKPRLLLNISLDIEDSVQSRTTKRTELSDEAAGQAYANSEAQEFQPAGAGHLFALSQAVGNRAVSELLKRNGSRSRPGPDVRDLRPDGTATPNLKVQAKSANGGPNTRGGTGSRSSGGRGHEISSSWGHRLTH